MTKREILEAIGYEIKDITEVNGRKYGMQGMTLQESGLSERVYYTEMAIRQCLNSLGEVYSKEYMLDELINKKACPKAAYGIIDKYENWGIGDKWVFRINLINAIKNTILNPKNKPNLLF